MPKIILDTNFLLIPIQFNVDIFAELDRINPNNAEICVLDLTMQELNKIKETGNTQDKTAAKVATGLIKQKHLKVVRSSFKNSVDDTIVETAQKGDFVATQDKGLKQKLKAKKIGIITLKDKSHLIIEEK